MASKALCRAHDSSLAGCCQTFHTMAIRNEKGADLQILPRTLPDAASLLHTTAACTHTVPGGRNWAAEQLHKKLRVGGKSMVQIYHGAFMSLSDDASRAVAGTDPRLAKGWLP